MLPGTTWRLEIHDSLPSTSDACIARAEQGEPSGLAVLARRQTQARGSRGRSWTEPPSGNLALSVLLRAEPGAAWPFLAGLALHGALSKPRDPAPGPRSRPSLKPPNSKQPDYQGSALIGSRAEPWPLTLKWPNDILLAGRKLAGILIERSRDWLVIGFGANLAEAPALPDRPAACLAELAPAPDPVAVAHRLLAALDHWQAVHAHDGFLSIRDAWLSRAHPIGTELAVRAVGAQTTGSFAGIDADGALLLSCDGETRRFSTGDVLLLNGTH